jgi:chitodextrinase
MIFAWNEIGEGGYLMPTLGDPDEEWLDAVKSVVLGGSSDITAPSIPTNISAIAVSSSQINLSWTASTDDVGVTGYRVEGCSGSFCTNFDQIGTPTGTTFSYTSLFANTSYRYRIRATDAAGNFSGYSAIASATTQIDIGPVGY